MCLLLFGCNKTSSSKVISEYKKALKTDQYEVVGQMDIVSNEEMYHYDVKVDYMEGDYYKASLVNKDNNHEQIILKNESGVYVITPELNKSFKFQSEWPYNSSQAYILSSLLKDLENDSNVLVEERNDEYILTSSVNYPNNSSLISQKITFGKDYLSGGSAAQKSGKIQDAHEAIRPTDLLRTPEMMKEYLGRDELRLYTLIYKRFLASRMAPCVFDTVSTKIAAKDYTFKVCASKVAFDGYRAVYTSDDDEKDDKNALVNTVWVAVPTRATACWCTTSRHLSRLRSA